jgi:hypothetical protein
LALVFDPNRTRPTTRSPSATIDTDLWDLFLERDKAAPREMEGGRDRRQGTVIMVPIPKVGPGDWKSSPQSEPLPAPPIKLQPAPSRAWNSKL